jgi:hypothetical protein
VVDNQQVVADCVVAIDIPAREQSAGIRDGRAFLVKNMVTQLLRLPHLSRGLRESDLEGPDAAKRLGRPVNPGSPSLQSAIGLERRNYTGDAMATRRRTKSLKQATLRMKRSAGDHGVQVLFGMNAPKPYVWLHFRTRESAMNC